MSRDNSFFQPISGAVAPRFTGIATFMRLPMVPLAEASDVHIGLTGIPLDIATTNRPGARHGPRALRDASTLIRGYNPSTQVAPFELCNCADLGDVPINPADLQDSLQRITGFYQTLHDRGIAPLTAGGDHLVTLPIMRVIAGERPLGMIQFDAHVDTIDSYFGGSKYTHGTPFRRAIEEGLLDPQRTVQIGIRGSGYRDADDDWGARQGIRVITMDECETRGIGDVMAEARGIVGDGPVYVSFDIDCLDPAYAPGTGTPEIGGFTTREAQKMVRALKGLSVVGADVVEVSPPFDNAQVTAIAGANMLFELLCIMAEGSTAKA
ncbi:MAG: agmatinase [Candidatus Competibacterales bacterium]